MKLFILALSLFSTVALSEMIPGGSGSPAEFSQGLTLNGGSSLSNYDESTYTPTFSDFGGLISNVDTPVNFRHVRIGNWVYVSGAALVDQTGAGEGNFRISLPISSTLATFSDLVGSCHISDSGFKKVGWVQAETVSAKALCLIETSSSNINRNIFFNFRYIVL